MFMMFQMNVPEGSKRTEEHTSTDVSDHFIEPTMFDRDRPRKQGRERGGNERNKSRQALLCI